MKNFGFLFWAYNAVWIVLACYGGYLLKRLADAERRMRRIEDILSDRRGR